jgi:broad specificity phosphatase PhoE
MTRGAKITIIRNAHNDGSGLSELGIFQAREITGEYDLIICSPLQSAIDTYKYSRIKTRRFIIDENVREYKGNNEYDYFDDEPCSPELGITFSDRIYKFVYDTLPIMYRTYTNICIISHVTFIRHFTQVAIGRFINLSHAASYTYTKMI